MKKLSRDERLILPYTVPTDMNSFTFYLALSFLLGFTLITFVVALRSPFSRENIEYLVISLLLVSFFCVIVLKLHPGLWITESGIRYKEYFIFPDRKIAWADFREVKTTAATNIEEFIKRGRKWQGGIIEMDIHQVGSEAPNPLTINIKQFRLDGLVTLGEMIAQKAPHAKLDKGTENLRNGIPPSFIKNITGEAGVKALAPFMAYVLLTVTLLLLPGIWVVQDFRFRYGIISALFVFGLFTLWMDNFIWKDYLKHLCASLYYTGYLGGVIILWNVLQHLTGSQNPFIWERVQPFVLMWTFYVLLGHGILAIRQTKDKG